MKTTADFLDELKVKLDLPSDGRLADYLGMHRQYLSRYRNLVVSFDDAMALRVADLLEVDPAYVIACMHAQRAKVQAERNVWERIAKHYAHLALFMLTLAVTFTYVRYDLPSPDLLDSVAVHGAPDLNTVYYVKWLVSALLLLFSFVPLAFAARPDNRPRST